MLRAQKLLVVVATLLFLASSIAFAVAGLREAATRTPSVEDFSFSIPFPDWAHSLPGFELRPQTPFGHGIAVLAAPDSPALWVLLIAVWIAAASYAIRLAGELARPHARVATVGTHHPSHHHRWLPGGCVALSLALIGAAIWPWLARPWPLIGLPGAAAVAVLAILAVLPPVHKRGHVLPDSSIGLFAGWSMVALYACFAQLVAIDLGVSSTLAAIVAIILLLFSAIEVQLRIGAQVAFSLAVICALIGFASQAIGSDLSVAVTAIVAIAAMAAVMVRVLS